MIITLKNADFSSSNIGSLSTWRVTRSLGVGASYSGATSVAKGGSLNATVTISSGYELGDGGVVVTMGNSTVTTGVTVSGNIITITINAVTGNVTIKVPTKSVGGNNSGDSGNTPVNYTITYKYVDSSGATIKSNTTETVAAGTVKNFSTSNAPAISGYTVSSVSPTNTTINNNTTVTYTYNSNEAGEALPENCVSYIGADHFTDIGQRVQWNTDKWVDTHSGTTSAGTNLIPVSSEDSIWIEYIAVVNNQLASGGFYNEYKEFVAPLFWGTFGIDQATNASKKFVTPEAPVTIASVEAEFNCTIAYVKFTAWQSADENSTGNTTTEARVYYANGIPTEPTYTSYIGEETFSFNKHVIQDGAFKTTGSASAWATDYIAITLNQSVWLQYIFTMSTQYSCVGLFDNEKNLIKGISAAEFGLEQGGKFKTPIKPVKISDLGVENVAYVKFIAWDTSDGGTANTEARIYD